MNPEEMLWNCIPHPCQICKKHFQKRKCDIINDPDFKEVFNAIFATKIKKRLQSRCNAQVSNKQTRSSKTIYFIQLRGSRRLQNKVFVDYMWYFCNRGREILRELKISVFPLVRMLMADKMCIWQGIMRSKTIEMTKTIVKEGECTN